VEDDEDEGLEEWLGIRNLESGKEGADGKAELAEVDSSFVRALSPAVLASSSLVVVERNGGSPKSGGGKWLLLPSLDMNFTCSI